MGAMVFYVIIFSLLAVLLVVAGLTATIRRRNRLETAERHSTAASDTARRNRKTSREQSRQGRRKRH